MIYRHHPVYPVSAAATMSAATLVAPQRFELQDVPLPAPRQRQVRIRMQGCGVCASNVPPWEGRDWFEYPMAPGAPGHEGWGIVDEVGPGVRSLEIGDRVAALSQHAYAQYESVPAGMCVKINSTVEGRLDVPGEPLGCAMNIFRRAQIRPSQWVAIVGVGFLGALLIQLCKEARARVIAISRRPYSQRLARRMGADVVLDSQDEQDTLARVTGCIEQDSRAGEGALCPRVIECTGKQGPLNLAGKLCATRGRLVIAGYHQDGLREVNMQQWNWQGLDVINAHERDPAQYLRGIRQAVKAMHDRRLDPSSLFTHRFALGRVNDALEMTRSRPDGFAKALVMFDDKETKGGS